MKYSIIRLVPVLFSLAFTQNYCFAKSQNIDPLDQYNHIWDSPCDNSSGSMPLGNGDIGINAWVDTKGDLLFYIGKTDTWSENGRLLKMGRVRVSLSPAVFSNKTPYRQELQLRQGQWVVELGPKDDRCRICVWVDANNPVIHVEIESKRKHRATVQLESWRSKRRMLPKDELPYAYRDSDTPIYVEPDTIVCYPSDHIIWYHRNGRSVWRENLTLQSLDFLIKDLKDPLLDRTFGGLISGTDLQRVDSMTLKSRKANYRHDIAVYALTMQCDSIQAWRKKLMQTVQDVTVVDKQQARRLHRQWWDEFWNRSWVRLSGGDPKETRDISLGWHSHRYLIACGGRGAYPIKFNGSIFNMDGIPRKGVIKAGKLKKWNADFRAWGSPYWFQNTRQFYWPMLAAGDFDLMRPLFKMYRDALYLATARTKKYYQHEGAFFPETMLFWGTYADCNYGRDRRNLPLGLTKNRYIRRYWQGGLELALMMLDYYHYTADRQLFKQVGLPLAREIVKFFDQHWQRGPDGKIKIHPAQALETYWDVVNPLPEIAGLNKVLRELIALPHDMTSPAQRDEWKRILGDLPAMPIKRDDQGNRFMAAAQTIAAKPKNAENVAMYSVFPYRLYGVGRPDLKLMRYTYLKARPFRGIYHCWANDNVFAAWLGLASEARIQLARRFNLSVGCRFPAFYTHGDWIPDHDNGGVAQQAIQAMILQPVDDKIYLLPAWPGEWNVSFKLHAPKNTTIEGVYRAGKLEQMKVTPPSRRQDVIVSPLSSK